MGSDGVNRRNDEDGLTRRQATEDDVEGHSSRRAAPDGATRRQDQDGLTRRQATEDESDVEGHMIGAMNPILARDLARAKERDVQRAASRGNLISEAKRAIRRGTERASLGSSTQPPRAGRGSAPVCLRCRAWPFRHGTAHCGADRAAARPGAECRAFRVQDTLKHRRRPRAALPMPTVGSIAPVAARFEHGGRVAFASPGPWDSPPEATGAA
jgi:hypothetical protein